MGFINYILSLSKYLTVVCSAKLILGNLFSILKKTTITFLLTIMFLAKNRCNKKNNSFVRKKKKARIFGDQY